MKMSKNIQELAKAKVEAQKEVSNPKKNAENPYFQSKYATLDSVIDAYKTAYAKHGISVSENPIEENGNVGVQIILMHESGQYIIYDPFMMPFGKATAQNKGSATTYSRRYTLSAVMNIAADEDDDGNMVTDDAKKEHNKSKDEIGKPVLIAKFKQGGGTEEQFNEWYGKQIASGFNHNQMDQYLTKALMERNKQ